jgi:uncharacterized Zn finger protein
MTATGNASLETLITRERLRLLAGAKWFGRGEAYFSRGQVRSIRYDGEIIVSTVMGSQDYRVKLWIESEELAHSCSCPIGDEGAFCKHCVAVGLAWLAGADERAGTPAAPGITMDDVRAYLSGLSPADLADMIVARSREDDGLHRQLVLRAARTKHKQPDLRVWRQAIDEAVGDGDFISYGEAAGFARQIEEVIDSIADLLEEGHGETVIALSEYGLEALEEALGRMDDSNGEVGGLLDRLQDLHLAACRQSPPEAEDLAQRLFEWEIEGDWDVFHGAAATYAEILGERGLARYRALAEPEWGKVPALTPGQNDAERYGRRLRITSIMETLAKQAGDVEGVVAVKSRDLSLPYGFLQIAEIYKEAGQPDRALEWAERGWRAFAGSRPDERLREFIADAYHIQGRHDDAMALTWQAFADLPHFRLYERLKQHAERSDQWPVWRDKALSHIRERVAAERVPSKGQRGNASWDRSRRDHSVLVEIFLWEDDTAGAWREAQEGGCSRPLWLRLAAQREKAHPDDALAIYREQLPLVLAVTSASAYHEAVGFLRKIRKLLVASGRSEEFVRDTAQLRALHRRKRNFIKLLDQEGW